MSEAKKKAVEAPEEFNDGLGLFEGKYTPTKEIAWSMYNDALSFNTKINLADTVRANENFYIGKQWEGVKSNGLPTPQVNFLKRITGFTISTIGGDNIKINATPLAAYPGDDQLLEPVRIINDEFVKIGEQNNLPRLSRTKLRNSAVDGDGCLYSFWDQKMVSSPKKKGGIRCEVVDNTRVFFGNPNDNRVQFQPWIMISKWEEARSAKRRAKINGIADWQQIAPDDESEGSAVDTQKRTGKKVTTITMFWRDDETDEIWCYEFCQSGEIKQPFNTKIHLYPITWLCWDEVKDCYHGQAMITGMIPNQIFVNKTWAMSMISINRSAFPVTIYDNTKIKHWTNQVGAAFGVPGSVDNVAKHLDPPQISPQVFQYIDGIINETQESLGGTSAALGEGKAYNTSAILALQKASATPQQMTQQRYYNSLEDLGRIWLELMTVNYGKRLVDMPITDEIKSIYEQYNALSEEVGAPTMEIPKIIQQEFDFSTLRDHPMSIKIDVGGSGLFSETASLQTLDNLLTQNRITTVQYLEHIPDDNVAGRRQLIDELREQEEQQREMEAMMQAQQMMGAQNPGMGGGAPAPRSGGAVAETPQRAEERSTGFKELGEALRSVERRQAS